jgi:hypothetical protein
MGGFNVKKTERSFKEKAKEIIDVGTEGGVSTLSEIFLEGAVGAVIPGSTSVIFNYKQKRMEKNLLRYIQELQNRVDEIETNYRSMNPENKQLIKEYFAGLLCDYVIDEQEEEKIKYIANGFVSLTGKEKLEIDQTIIYLDILKSMRLIDIRIFHDLYNGLYFFDQDFNEYLDGLGIEHEAYKMIKEKLLRLGLLKSSYDDEYQKIVKKVNDLTDFAMSLQKGKPNRLSGNFTSFKPKDRESFKISNLGRSFIQFFTKEGDVVE